MTLGELPMRLKMSIAAVGTSVQRSDSIAHKTDCQWSNELFYSLRTLCLYIGGSTGNPSAFHEFTPPRKAQTLEYPLAAY
jgi:hypothetical protein